VYEPALVTAMVWLVKPEFTVEVISKPFLYHFNITGATVAVPVTGITELFR